MRNSLLRATPIALAATILAATARGQATGPPSKEPARNPLTGDAEAIRQGAILFRQGCVFCHGAGGRGGARGPDLTTGAWAHGGSDAELARTITNGVPGTQMAANELTENEIWQIVAYLRTRQQAPAAQTGDPRRGETLFFGSARCSTCHMVNGRGGRVGPELSFAGSSRPRAYLIESIREPNRALTENLSFGDAIQFWDTVTAVTRDGATIVGVPMNEDTFTVQIMDSRERIHSLEKKSLKSLRHEKRSLMPAYGADILGESDLQDVVAYLSSLHAPTPVEKGESHANQ
ncbi:MAG TPA: c-type cytochrome [Candidatus Acidoferrales bacterium]|nr:c-type cytochrome [Candidatus Acidoferrales bacterium]